MNEEMNVTTEVTMEEEITLQSIEPLLKIGVIGTGNCGCQIANLACETLGIDGIAINGSKKDLDILTSPKLVRIQVGDGKGTGKDRTKAKEFFLADSGLVLDKSFQNVIENNDVILVVTSTGGGYGSGSSTELLELLTEMYKNKVFIAVGVLPFGNEGYAAFQGTKDWLKELGKLNLGYMIYDNNRFKNLAPNKAAAIINDAVITDISVLRGDYLGKTLTGGIDERDMLTVLSASGRIVVASMIIDPSDIKDDSIVKTIENYLRKESAHAEMVTDKEIAASALMYNLGDEYDEFKTKLKDELQETFGAHVKDPTNFCDENLDQGGHVAVVLAGLTEPAMVIDRLINRMQTMGESIVGRKNVMSKLNKVDDNQNAKLNVTAKQSFADEAVVVNNSVAGETPASQDEILQKFLKKKNAK